MKRVVVLGFALVETTALTSGPAPPPPELPLVRSTVLPTTEVNTSLALAVLAELAFEVAVTATV